MSRRRATALISTAAIAMVAVGVAINEVYDDERATLRWYWLAAALSAAVLSVWIGLRLSAAPPRAELAVTDGRGRPPTMGLATPSMMGIHPSHLDFSGNAPYVAREADGLIAEALRRRTVIVVHGQRLAGSTRSLAHVACRHLQDKQLLVFRPDPLVSLRDLVNAAQKLMGRNGGAVLWLDSLTPSLLAQLDASLIQALPSDLQVCATTETSVLFGRQTPAHVKDALASHATLVEIGSATAAERQAIVTDSAYSTIHAAAETADPILVGRLMVSLSQIVSALSFPHEAQNHRVALVRVVTDWERIGMPGGLTRKVLWELYARYWNEIGAHSAGTAASRSAFRQALRWATASTAERPRLVDKVAGNHYVPNRLLGVLADNGTSGWKTSSKLWSHAARTLALQDRMSLAFSALDREEPEHAPRLLRTVDLTDAELEISKALNEALFAVGMWMTEVNDESGARRWYLLMIKSHRAEITPRAMIMMASAERKSSNVGAARSWYLRAMETGDNEAFAYGSYLLGDLEDELGDPAAARAWFCGTVAGGHPDLGPSAMFALGDLEARNGHEKRARLWYTRAIASHHPDAGPRAMVNLGRMARNRGDATQARAWFMRAYRSTHDEASPTATFSLGLLEDSQGDHTSARSWYLRTIESNQPDKAPQAMANMGTMASRADDTQQARQWWTAAIATNHVYASSSASLNLGLLEEREGNFAEAYDCFLHVVHLGHPEVAPSAMASLGLLESQGNNVAQSRVWHARAIRSGHPLATGQSLFNLAVLESDNRNAEEAWTLYTEAAASENPKVRPLAMEALAAMARDQGDDVERRRWLVAAAGTDHPGVAGPAALAMASMDLEAGRLSDARAWLQQAARSPLPGIVGVAKERLSHLDEHGDRAAG